MAKNKKTLNEAEDVIFVLNTQELKDAGFDGSFNDLAADAEDAGATVSGEYDEDGTPIMSIYGLETEDVENLLSDYGIEEPSQFTGEVEDGDEFDFDEGGEETPADEGEPTDTPEDDDEEFEIVDDEDDAPVDAPVDESKKTPKTKPQGTQNLSEAVTIDILNQVKDSAIQKRIMEDMKSKIEQQELLENYKAPIPFAGVKVNGKEVVYESVATVQALLNEAKSNYKKYYKKYKTLNESENKDTKVKYTKVLRKQHKLIQLLESVLALKTGKLFEGLFDDVQTDGGDNGDATTQPTDDANATQDDGQEMSDQTGTLTAIVFKVKSGQADNFIKILTDNGIPEEALKKGGDDEGAGSDEQQQDQTQDQGAADANTGAAPAAPAGGADMGGGAAPAGGNPFESLSTRLTQKNKLNEDDANPFAPDGGDGADANPFGDTDQPAADSGTDPLNTESHDNSDEGEEVRLVDTSYAKKVQEILQDKFGYSKEEFEDKIGGEIMDDGQEDGDEGDGSDGTQPTDDAATDDSAKDDEDGTEEDINPEDVFAGLDI